MSKKTSETTTQTTGSVSRTRVRMERIGLFHDKAVRSADLLFGMRVVLRESGENRITRCDEFAVEVTLAALEACVIPEMMYAP